jgi:uncharacterized cupin superfamily protein
LVGHSGKIVRMDLNPPFALAVADAVLSPDELDPGQIVSGDPRVASVVLHSSPATEPGGRVVERGVWEITPGVVTDVEADEVFVVLTGRATIEFEDGRALEVGPGDVAVLPEGAVTRWTVHETLRKVYQVTYVSEADERG